jgi:hypothetical protein
MPSSHLFFNHEHSNTMNTHIFFCTNDECGNVAPEWGALCMGCEPTHVCSGEWDYELGYRVCDNSDDEDCPQHEPQCTDEKHCRDCHRERYGVPENKPVHKSLESMRDEIAEIEACLRSNMTKGQKDDWIWILQNRRADLAEAEKEMWAGYDEDDLRKMDQANRRGF